MSVKKNIQLDHSQHRPSGVRYPVCLLAHDLQSADNVGSLFRIADALGLEKIILSGSTPAPPNSRLKKTSRSTDAVVDHLSIEDPVEYIASLKADGYTVISLELTTNSRALSDLSLQNDSKVCVIVGSEYSGVEQALLDVSDLSVHIPMQGQNSSMNVAMACAIAAYQIVASIEN